MDIAAGTNGSANHAQTGTARVKRGMAEMLKGGVIMDIAQFQFGAPGHGRVETLGAVHEVKLLAEHHRAVEVDL